MSTADSRRGGMSTGGSLLTRPAAATGPDGLTQVTDDVGVLRAPRSRPGARGRLVGGGPGASGGPRSPPPRRGARARCDRPACCWWSRRRRVSCSGSRSAGSSGWSRERHPCFCWSRACPSCSGRARTTSSCSSRTSASSPATTSRARSSCATTGAGSRCPVASTSPSGGGSWSSACRCCDRATRVGQPLDIPALARGIVAVGPATTVRSDPIGLLRREHAFADVHQLYVHPRTTALPSTSAGLIRDLEGSPTRRLVDSDMSFHAIREYTAGDSRRQIHWKSTAKTGRLMVRQYEESRRSRMAVVLAVAEAEYSDADEFELAVSCAASLGLRAVRDARDVAIVTGSEIPRVVRGRLRAITHLPASAPRPMLDSFSAVERLENTMPVAEVCRLTAESGDRLSIAFVLVGSRVGAQPPAEGRTHVPRRDRRRRGHLRRARASPDADARGAHGPHGRDPRRSVRPAAARSHLMSARDAVIRPAATPRIVPRVLAGSLFAAAIVALAAIAAWPIYRSPQLLAAGDRRPPLSRS